MKITVTAISPSPSGIRLGCVLTGPQRSWVRFLEVRVPWSMMTGDVLKEWAHQEMVRQDRVPVEEDQGLPLDWS